MAGSVVISAGTIKELIVDQFQTSPGKMDSDATYGAAKLAEHPRARMIKNNFTCLNTFMVRGFGSLLIIITVETGIFVPT